MFFQRLVASIVVLGVSISFTFSQTLYTTITPAGKPVNVKGMMVGEDIFLSMQLAATRGPENFSVLVDPSGKQKVLDLSGIGDYPIVAGVRRNDSTCFYYLGRLGKTVALATLALEANTGASTKLPDYVPIPGEIYGSYVEDNDLYMLCAVKNEYKLRLLQIRNGSVKSTIEFPLTFNLGKRKDQRVTFMDLAKPVTPQEAIGHIKICKNGRAIWILIDEPANDRDVTQTANTLFRTTAIKLDLDSKSTIVRSFYEPEMVPFTSAVLGNDIYRLVLGRTLRVDQFDFYSGKKKNSVPMASGKQTARDSTYARIASKVRTQKSVKGVLNIERPLGSFFIADSLSNGERIFTVGYYGDDYMRIGGLGGSVPAIASLIVTASSLIVGELFEGNLSTVYYYFRGTMDSGIAATYDVPFLRKQVDEYDSRQQKNKQRFDFRGYLNLPTTTFEFAQPHKTNIIEIRKFTLDQASVSSGWGDN